MNSKIKMLVAGFVMGSLTMLSVSAFGDGNFISAVRGEFVNFKFDGMPKLIPSDYATPSIVYEDRIYVPARFIAEQLGATVNWNAKDTTVEITSPAPKVVEKEVIKEVVKEVPVLAQETRSYTSLPIKKQNKNFAIEVTGIYGKKDDETYTKIYLSVDSTSNARPILLDYSSIEVEVDGKAYSVNDVAQIYRDSKWFNTIYQDESKSGYITIKAIPKDAKYIHMKLKMNYNDGQSDYEEYEFNFKVE